VPPKITPEKLDAAGGEMRAYYRQLSELLVRRGLQPLPECRIYVSRKIRRNYGYCAFRNKGEAMVVEKIAIAWQAYRKGPSMWQDVMAHEAAHAYCMAHHNRADHSPSWRHIARLLGCTGDVVGCEDPNRRDHARRAADAMPTLIAKLSARDQASLRRSFTVQRAKTRDDLSAVHAVVRRFPQFEEAKVREYLLRVCGLTPPRQGQLALPF
jgi:hypothetical protein